jgi:hypothetical protein
MAPPLPVASEPRLYVAEPGDGAERQAARDLQPDGGPAREGR